jgi:hypothetical protein
MRRRWVFWGVMSLLLSGCGEELASNETFYEARIQPSLEVGCVQQTSGCHLATDDGTATGNLDLSSFDALMRRDDALPAYGPYPLGLLLLKGGPDREVSVETFGSGGQNGDRFVQIQTDIRHNAGSGISLDSSSFREIRQWIEAGFTRNGVPPQELTENKGSCVTEIGSAHGFDPNAEPADAQSFDAFVSNVQPVLNNGCAGSQCHGNPIADLYLTCGETPKQRRWNYFVAKEHLDEPVSTSELLRRPLSDQRGGAYHEGGDVIASTSEQAYQTLFDWAADLVQRRPELIRPETDDEGLRFFANRVQPALVRKGCMFLNCHSRAMFHELRLRGGADGMFSSIATRKNYEMSKEMLAIESPNPNEARLIAKNLLFSSQHGDATDGIPHRGGQLLEDFGGGESVNPATPDDCSGVDADSGDLNEIPAYCVLVRWHQIERENAIDEGEVTADGLDSVVWVERPPGIGDVRDFHTFRGGADLRSAPAMLEGDGSVSLGSPSTLLGDCGIPDGADIRTPAVSWHAERIAFAARPSEDKPLRLYWMRPDGSQCERIPGIAPGSERADNGILLHDFDPAFAPDGRIVFASTRGNLSGPDYGGPTRTPAAMQPNANLYIYDPDGQNVRQMTYLLNQELAPSFKADGRVIFTTEKRQPDFHQMALRRQNLDGADYHPLFAQRGSVGYRSATEVVELPNGNLAYVAGPLPDPGADPTVHDGAGTIVVANRSIGPDQDDRDPSDRFYIHSMHLPRPGAFGTIPDVPTRSSSEQGVFRSPAPLPSGRMLVSCDRDATSLQNGPYPYDLCELDPETGEVRELVAGAGTAAVEPVAVYGRPDHGVFQSRRDEPNGRTRIVPDREDAVVHVLDFPLLETLLFSNTRTGLPIDHDVGGIRVYRVNPPAREARSFGDLPGEQIVEDEFGRMHSDMEELGFVPLNADGSAKFRFPGGTPIVLGVTDQNNELLEFNEDDPFEGPRIQKEQMQFYPGERIAQSFPREDFNGLCGGCHGSLRGRELDVAVEVDVLTSASQTQAKDQSPVDLSP